MAISKLNKYLWICILIIFSCNDTSIKEKNVNLCNNDSIINLRNNKLSLWFINDSTNILLQDIKIEQIRKGKVISNLKYQRDGDGNKNRIDINNSFYLKTNDSLKIMLKNNKSFLLYDFKNIPDYGGKKLLGCSLGTYKINGKEMAIIDWETLRVF